MPQVRAASIEDVRSCGVLAGKFYITEFVRGLSLTSAVGLVRFACGLRKPGRAEYDPLCRCGGGAAWTPPVSEKIANTMFAIFSSSQPAATAAGCPSPFEPLMKGL